MDHVLEKHVLSFLGQNIHVNLPFPSNQMSFFYLQPCRAFELQMGGQLLWKYPSFLPDCLNRPDYDVGSVLEGAMIRERPRDGMGWDEGYFRKVRLRSTGAWSNIMLIWHWMNLFGNRGTSGLAETRFTNERCSFKLLFDHMPCHLVTSEFMTNFCFTPYCMPN